MTVVRCHRVPPSHLAHVAHHREGPCHFVTILGIRVVRVRRMARSSECARSASSAIGTSGCWWASRTPDCEFVGACPAFPAAARWECRADPARPARVHAWRRTAVPCAASAGISPGANSVACRSTPRGETAQPSHQSVSNPLTRVSVTLSQRICASGTDPLKEYQKHALTGENRVNGNAITLC